MVEYVIEIEMGGGVEEVDTTTRLMDAQTAYASLCKNPPPGAVAIVIYQRIKIAEERF